MSDPFQEILDTNGNNHHAKVVSVFRSLGWQALVSPYYSDNFTDKAREIDVIVENDYNIDDNVDRFDPVRIRFFLECKYIVQESVLWFDKKDIGRTRGLVDAMFNTNTDRFQHEISNYYYGGDIPVVKLFASKGGRSGENEPLAKAVNQCLNAFIYYRNEQTASLPAGKNLSSTLSYPVIVCNSFDKFRMVPMYGLVESPKKITEPFQLEVNYAYLDHSKKPQNEFFLIDVITIDQIEDYIQNIFNKDVVAEASRVRLLSYESDSTSEESFDPYTSL